MLRSALAALSGAALATSALAAPAHANPAKPAGGVAIRYADLDLSSDAGRATLDRRIAAAARSLCAATNETGYRAANARARRECLADVRAEALSKMPERLAARAAFSTRL